MKIVNVPQMQKAERDCSKFGVSLARLMENAGKAVADEMGRILGGVSEHCILVLVGPGNNGGDGLVAARHLHDGGATVLVYLCASRSPDDLHLEQLVQRNISIVSAGEDSTLGKLNEWLASADTLLDAVFGTGASRPISGIFAQILQGVRRKKEHCPRLRIVALDLPSGLNADSGSVDPATPCSDYTVALGFPKIGLFSLPGAKYAGRISVVDIGIPESLASYVKYDLLSSSWVASHLPARSLVAHKGTFGKVLAFIGSLNYTGAAFLACTSSMRVGAGLTTLAIARTLVTVLATKTTEVTYLPLPESSPAVVSREAVLTLRQALGGYSALLVGCGSGQDPAVVQMLEQLLLDSPVELPPLVVDADGINALSRVSGWQDRVRHNAILTPHAGEMSRLLGKPAEEIQANRLGTAQQAAVSWAKIVVLKGAYTVVASPDERVRVSPFANPALATAGTGDVLAGAIAGMLSQGLSPFDAAACGVYVHGKAGEIVKGEIGEAGALASDLLPALPRAIRQLKQV